MEIYKTHLLIMILMYVTVSPHKWNMSTYKTIWSVNHWMIYTMYLKWQRHTLQYHVEHACTTLGSEVQNLNYFTIFKISMNHLSCGLSLKSDNRIEHVMCRGVTLLQRHQLIRICSTGHGNSLASGYASWEKSPPSLLMKDLQIYRGRWNITQLPGKRCPEDILPD